MIPLLHDFAGTTVLVFGGGPVGARKARRFAHEARVVVVSPAFAATEFGGAERVRAAPAPEDVPGWFDRAVPALVVAATDSEEVNDAVTRAARERGVLCNRADSSRADADLERTNADGASGPTPSDPREPADEVVVPATVRDDPVVVAVATGARSPALSRHLRERIAADVEGAGAMAELTGELRTALRERDLSPNARREALRTVVRSERVWKGLGVGSPDARREATAVIDEVLPTEVEWGDTA
jgi:precorrin-2 dehydrogenase/sirohydrochlorin ferrochelatase